MFKLGADFDVISAIVPVDLQTAANDGDWFSLKNWQGCTVIVFKGAGTAGDDPSITIEQATSVAGGSAKVLNAISEFYKKIGSQVATGTWTKVTQTLDELVTVDAVSAEAEGLWVFNIEADQLDVDGGFDCVRVRIADVGGNAQLGCALYLPHGPRYGATPANLPSSIVD